MFDDPAIVEKAKKRAKEIFNTHRANCAESVFRTIFEMVDSDFPPEVSTLLTPLGGGIGTRGETCGALLGGVIALGLAQSRSQREQDALENHRKDLWQTYKFYNQLPQRFHEKFGSTQCWDLTKDRIYGTRECRLNCAEITGEAAGMVVELLLESRKNGLNFKFGRTVLEQAAEATGLSIDELISYKAKGKDFPINRDK